MEGCLLGMSGLLLCLGLVALGERHTHLIARAMRRRGEHQKAVLHRSCSSRHVLHQQSDDSNPYETVLARQHDLWSTTEQRWSGGDSLRIVCSMAIFTVSDRTVPPVTP